MHETFPSIGCAAVSDRLFKEEHFEGVLSSISDVGSPDIARGVTGDGLFDERHDEAILSVSGDVAGLPRYVNVFETPGARIHRNGLERTGVAEKATVDGKLDRGHLIQASGVSVDVHGFAAWLTTEQAQRLTNCYRSSFADPQQPELIFSHSRNLRRSPCIAFLIPPNRRPLCAFAKSRHC